MARGRHRGRRPLDLLRTRTAERGSRYREEEPGRAAQGPGARGPDAGRRRPSVRASGPGPLRVRPKPRRSRRPAPAPHLDHPRRLGRGHPHGRDRREGPPDPRKLRPGVPVPRRPDGPAAFPGHRPDAPLRRRLAARVRLSLLRLLGLLAAGRGRPGVLRDVVVDRAPLLGLFLRLLGLDELHDSLFSEHPVVDPPLPAGVERRLFPLRRQDAGILPHREGVEWVQTSKPGLVSRAPEEFEGELRELRDEVRRLREQVAALATATARPSPLDERLPTFVGRLDPSLEGGVPKGSVIAISGPGGSMKTSLALYILLKNRAAGRRGVYVTVEESRDSISRTMRHLGLGKEDDFLVDIARLRIEREGAEDIRDWLRVLKEFLVRRYQRERFDLLVIDTMDVLASMAHLEDARNELFHFFHFLRSMGVTTYAIANVEPARGGISHDVAFLADGVFELRFSGAGEGKVQLLFRCAKMRHTNHSRDYFVLTYDKGFAARPYEAPKSSRWGR